MTHSHQSQGASPIQYSDIANQVRNDELNRQIAEFVANGGKIRPWGEPMPKKPKRAKTAKQTIQAVKEILAEAGIISHAVYDSLNPHREMKLYQCIRQIKTEMGWDITACVIANGEHGYKVRG